MPGARHAARRPAPDVRDRDACAGATAARSPPRSRSRRCARAASSRSCTTSPTAGPRRTRCARPPPGTATSSKACDDWIWTADRAGVVTFSSRGGEAVLGYRPARLIGHSLFDIVAPEPATTRPAVSGRPPRPSRAGRPRCGGPRGRHRAHARQPREPDPRRGRRAPGVEGSRAPGRHRAAAGSPRVCRCAGAAH